jgi:hypothetical protein
VTSPVPGPPASVLSAVLRQSPSHPYDATDPTQRRRATFTAGSSLPDLPSLVTDVVFLPQDAFLDANVTIGGTLDVLGSDSNPAATPDWINAVDSGADPTGTLDSTTAIQSAINAAAVLGTGGGVVYLPPGTYKTSSALTPASGVQITADSYLAAQIISTSSSIFNMAPETLLDNVEISHLTLQVTGSDLFTGANLARPYIHDCQFIQNSAGNAIWNAPSVTLLIEGRFERNTERVHGATRSVAAWFLSSPSNSHNVNVCRWEDNVCFNTDGDATQYWYNVVATTAGTTNNEQNSFRNIVFETPYGGMIWVDSGSYTEVTNCLAWDAASTIMNDLIKFTKNATGATPVGNIIRQSGKVTGSLNAGVADISIDANCVVTLIENPAATVINLHGSTKTVLNGLISAISILNGPTVAGRNTFMGAESALAVSAVVNTTSAPTNPASQIVTAAAADNAFGIRVSGDTSNRVVTDSNGQMSWGPGNATQDANLYRASTNILATDNSFQALSGFLKTSRFVCTGITGATAASRYAGGTAAGAPTSGTFQLGDFVIDQAGNTWVCTTAGTPGTWLPLAGGQDNWTQPLTDCVGATFTRSRATSVSSAPTSGTLYVAAIGLAGGVKVSKATFFTNTTAKTGGSHGWYVLLDSGLAVRAVTTDQTDAATVWGTISTGYPLSFAAPYTTTYAGLYYIGVMVAASGMPTFTVSSAVAGGINQATGIGGGLVMCGTSSTSQTTAPTVTTVMGAVVASATFNFYAYLE